MANEVTFNPGVGGAMIKTESMGGQEMPICKIHTGADFADGGSVTAGNPFPVHEVSAIVPSAFDTIDLAYTGANLTSVVYKLGGSTVATLTLSYAGSNLTSVVRT